MRRDDLVHTIVEEKPGITARGVQAVLRDRYGNLLAIGAVRGILGRLLARGRLERVPGERKGTWAYLAARPRHDAPPKGSRMIEVDGVRFAIHPEGASHALLVLDEDQGREVWTEVWRSRSAEGCAARAVYLRGTRGR